ncbi:HlyD family efflux transporter periplasmic adaptor subunit [Oleomonas cavernae]|uniref:HlyD family efflux transporter periplasmic adaptor subunit n=1 Tax=Oleomonas cavernae TaxID=2320859 RepID=A0A418WCF1_9PROT|nr:HlyD family efflux transporter periplasmic adaptor subunit [Oleomonas cavernae]RJF87702.1 HlyD family efflux transporter periplasmic adaptor subunit [Oleomonas cavernae]
MTRTLSPFVLLALILAGCGDNGGQVTVQGYAEGDFVTVAATAGGRLTARPVNRGDVVKAGDALFALDATAATASRDQAAASLAQAQADLADSLKGSRPTEVAAIDAQIAEARSALDLARIELARTQRLTATQVASRQGLDKAQATVEQAQARLEALEAQRDTATLGARDDRILAARAAVAAASATLADAEWQLAERQVTAPVAGIVSETIRDPGEVVAAGAPVLTLLPDDGTKIRFFLPETLLPKVAPGDTVRLACDGCPGDLAARVTYVAPKEEFTPPTVYTVTNRETFVYLVEARQSAGATRLRPGQPLDVTIGAP